MKQDIEWHENCLKNRKATLGRERDRVARLMAKVDEATRGCNVYLAQIQLAKKEKKDGFDRDLYALKRLGE